MSESQRPKKSVISQMTSLYLEALSATFSANINSKLNSGMTASAFLKLVSVTKTGSGEKKMFEKH